MKALKRAFALVLTLAIIMSLGITAFAGGPAAKPYTIEITNPARSGVSMKGQTFKAYKIFDAVYDKPDNPKASVTYTVTEEFGAFSMTTPDTMTEEFDTTITGDELPEYVAKLQNDSEELYKFGKAAIAFAKEDNNILAKDIVTVVANGAPEYTKDGSGNEIVKIAVTQPGYYLIDCNALEGSNSLNTVALTTARPNAKFILKLGKPTLDKNLVVGGKDTGIEDVFTTEIGKELTFNLDTVVPNMAGYSKFLYEFKDVLGTGLTLDTNSVTIQVFGRKSDNSAADTAKTTFAVRTDYTQNAAEKGGKTVLTLTFNDLKAVLASAAHNTKGIETGDIMRVTYNAKLNGDALSRNMVNNVANLTYSNDPSNVDREEITDPNTHITTDGTDTTPDDEVKL